MMRVIRVLRSGLNFAVAIVSAGLGTACVSSPHPEAAGSSVPAAASSGNASPYAAPPPAASRDENATRQPSGAPGALAPAAAATPVPIRTDPSTVRGASKSAPARARTNSTRRTDSNEKTGTAGESMLSRPDDLSADPLVPTLEDAPEIRTALQDLKNAADVLAAEHDCNEGCRAFQSMQRAAARICDLVSDQDPMHRCASARTKVSVAEQELRKRCARCPE